MPNPAIQIRPDAGTTTVLHHVDHDLAVGEAANLLLIVWRDRTTSTGVDECFGFFRQAFSNRGREFALVTIIEPSAKLPESRERKRIAELLTEASDRIQVSALVFEGSGFLAAAIRSVVAGITLMAHQSFPHRIFESVHDAAHFIERRQLANNPAPFVARDVELAVANLRQQVATRGAS